jgi:uncharacterized protein YqcC (DUF446 family)
MHRQFGSDFWRSLAPQRLKRISHSPVQLDAISNRHTLVQYVAIERMNELESRGD